MEIRKRLVLVLVVLALPLAARAQGTGRLRLSVSDATVVVGQEMMIDVLVEDVPPVYGADLRLTFDPGLLEVVDADEVTPGTQLEPGGFIDVEKSFVLQHGVDNEGGTIDYALALLNPAPPVEGDGHLMRVRFRTKAEGQATVSIGEGLFGTQTGATLEPELDGVVIDIVAEESGGVIPISKPIQRLLDGDDASEGSTDLGVVVLGAVLVIGLIGTGLLGRRLWRRRRQHG